VKILGLGGAFGHDPSSALLVDGEIIAAAEEERFRRVKHAYAIPPVLSARFCLERAGISPSDVDVVAYPFSAATQTRRRSEYARRVWSHNPIRAIRAYTEHGRKIAKKRAFLRSALDELGIPASKIVEVDHHLAHASSAFHLSGFESAAILSIDGAGEYTCTFLGEGVPGGAIHEIKTFVEPDSLGNYFAAITEYLGFLPNDGEFKVMGMAPYGDASKVDMSFLLKWGNGSYRVEDGYIWAPWWRRAKGLNCDRRLIERLGPAREGDEALEPYIHIAAAIQKQLEEIAVHLVETQLAAALKRSDGRLCVAGGCALNVKMNQVLLEHPLVKEVFVQPVANDAGTSLGAATYAAWSRGETVRPMKHLYLGPESSSAEIEAAIRASGLPHTSETDIVERVARLLSEGGIVAWFQGRMEFGPRSLGNRSILANPSIKGMADEINLQIKFREKWRPFCPSIQCEAAADVLDSTHPAPYMILAFQAGPKYRDKIAEAVHIDGSIRPQVVDPEANPRYHALLTRFRELTGVPAVINTSLNRRGEPMICRPEEAIDMFLGSGLKYLAMGDFLVRKR
jgi:carbamoyltransferase